MTLGGLWLSCKFSGLGAPTANFHSLQTPEIKSGKLKVLWNGQRGLAFHIQQPAASSLLHSWPRGARRVSSYFVLVFLTFPSFCHRGILLLQEFNRLWLLEIKEEGEKAPKRLSRNETPWIHSRTWFWQENVTPQNTIPTQFVSQREVGDEHWTGLWLSSTQRTTFWNNSDISASFS